MPAGPPTALVAESGNGAEPAAYNSCAAAGTQFLSP